MLNSLLNLYNHILFNNSTSTYFIESTKKLFSIKYTDLFSIILFITNSPYTIYSVISSLILSIFKDKRNNKKYGGRNAFFKKYTNY